MNLGANRRAKDPNQLTPREAQVIELKRDGKTMKQIAEILGISYNTVDSLLVKARDKERWNEQV